MPRRYWSKQMCEVCKKWYTEKGDYVLCWPCHVKLEYSRLNMKEW